MLLKKFSTQNKILIKYNQITAVNVIRMINITLFIKSSRLKIINDFRDF